MHRHVYMRDVFTVCEKETTNENRNITKIRKTIKSKEKKETSARKIAPKIPKKKLKIIVIAWKITTEISCLPKRQESES